MTTACPHGATVNDCPACRPASAPESPAEREVKDDDVILSNVIAATLVRMLRLFPAPLMLAALAGTVANVLIETFDEKQPNMTFDERLAYFNQAVKMVVDQGVRQ